MRDASTLGAAALASFVSCAILYWVTTRRKRPAKPSDGAAAAVVDVAPFLEDPSSEASKAACDAVAASLKATGIVLLRDPRVSTKDQATFLDMMEDYFAQPTERKMPDVREELHYQVGATPSMVEIPICKADDECKTQIEAMPPEHRPLDIKGPDPKWRFFWRIGERPKSGGFEALNAEPVLPAAFPQWKPTMDAWGTLMLHSVTTCAEMAAVGLGLERDAISKLMEFGPHLLAPTGSDLGAHREVGTVLAGFHNDLNLLTIHGKSRYPGLFVWLTDGTKMAVKVPDGCLLVQAGLQIERLTGGAVQAVSKRAASQEFHLLRNPSYARSMSVRACAYGSGARRGVRRACTRWWSSRRPSRRRSGRRRKAVRRGASRRRSLPTSPPQRRCSLSDRTRRPKRWRPSRPSRRATKWSPYCRRST